MDVTQALKDTENLLRDFIAFILSNNFSSDWESKCGVTEDRLKVWKQRKEAENKRQESGVMDERLIYYADFYDLKTVLKKHWNLFSGALGDLKTCEVWLSELEKLRDPDAHRRELLPHQKHLILGLCGELRTKIARFRSAQDNSEAYYPRIEFAADNLGNSWKIGESSNVHTDKRLRPGDTLEYIVTASDPLGEPVLFKYAFGEGPIFLGEKWTSDNSCTVVVTEKDVGKSFYVTIYVKSTRKFHANKGYDDDISFRYEVLPPR